MLAALAVPLLAMLASRACRHAMSAATPEPVPWSALSGELVLLRRLLRQIQDDRGHNRRNRLLAWVLRLRLRLRLHGAAEWDTVSARCQRQLTRLLCAHAQRALDASDRRQLDRALVIVDLTGIGSAAQRPAARTGGGAHPDTGSLRPTSGKRHTVRHPRRQPP